MIVVVKKKNMKKVIVKALVLLFLVGMFGAYYLHMSNVFVDMEDDMTKETTMTPKKKELTKEEKLALKLEDLFYSEAETIEGLLGQKYIRKVYVTKKSLIFHCDNNTNIEPLLIKYGTNANYKSGIDFMTISIDLNFIVEENFINEI